MLKWKYGFTFVLTGALASGLMSQTSWAYQDYGNQLNLGYQDDVDYGVVQLRPAQPQASQAMQIQDRRVAPLQGQVVVPQAQQPMAFQQQPMAFQQQPMTYVEARPLNESKAGQMRRAREGAELQTEQKIVEKLEESRLKDEQRRAERLFGNRLSSEPAQSIPTTNDYGAIAAPVQQATQSQTTGQAVHQVVVVRDDASPVSARAEIDREIEKEVERASSRSAEKQRIEYRDEYSGFQLFGANSRFFMGAEIGLADYFDADNVSGELATGFSLGSKSPNGLVVEAGFLYSNFLINEFWQRPVFREMDQYNFTLAAKFSPLKGSFQPYGGAVASYTYRRYSDRQFFWGSSSFHGHHGHHGQWPNDRTASSNAFDLGFNAGLDLKVTHNFSLGTEFRYMVNMINNSRSEFLNSRRFWATSVTSPIEEFSYYSWTLNGKIHF